MSNRDDLTDYRLGRQADGLRRIIARHRPSRLSERVSTAIPGTVEYLADHEHMRRASEPFDDGGKLLIFPGARYASEEYVAATPGLYDVLNRDQLKALENNGLLRRMMYALYCGSGRMSWVSLVESLSEETISHDYDPQDFGEALIQAHAYGFVELAAKEDDTPSIEIASDFRLRTVRGDELYIFLESVVREYSLG